MWQPNREGTTQNPVGGTFHNAGVLRAIALHAEQISQRSNMPPRSLFQTWSTSVSLAFNMKRKISDMISTGSHRQGEIKARWNLMKRRVESILACSSQGTFFPLRRLWTLGLRRESWTVFSASNSWIAAFSWGEGTKEGEEMEIRYQGGLILRYSDTRSK